jgi:5-formyltetrahydrofolate cyclo-ligase
MDQRQQIRQALRARRDAQSLEQCQLDSARICETLIRSPILRRAKRIACYFAHGKEVDLTNLMLAAWQRNKQIFLPVLAQFPKGHLWWLPYTVDTPLYRNRFGISEPQHPKRLRRTKLRSLDVILMPLVAFDAKGHRIGMGGGFYDRSLARLHHDHSWHRPLRIGVAFSWQQVPSIRAQAWDIPLDAVATEQSMTFF